jgi:dihydroorotase
MPSAPYLLAGGRVIDPAAGRNEIADVVVVGDRIAAVGAGAGLAYPAAEVRDCRGLIVTPGLIDLHTHVVPGLGDFCVHPDRAGVEVGVPVVVDGGTSGTATYGIAQHFWHSVDVATRVLAFLDPNALYLATKDFVAHRLHIADDPRNLALDAAEALFEEHPDSLVGFKVRCCTVDDPRASPFLDGAKSIAGERPIMIHLGRFPHTPSLSNLDAIAQLRPGDIVTHALRGHSGFPLPGGGVAPEFRDAVERGVRLDIGHSGSDFRFAAARELLELGYRPDTISTDLNLFNEKAPVRSLPETMSKLLALGVPLVDVIAMTTSTAAEVLHRQDELGTLLAGRVAEVSVLAVDEGEYGLSDGFEQLVATTRLRPIGCLRAGVWFDADASRAVGPALSRSAA